MYQGVIETIIKDCPLLQFMPWVEIVGNALTYNRELTLPTAEWHAVNDDWNTSPAITFTQKTATLAILGQNADVDNYIKQTRSNIMDVESAIIELTAKAIRHELEDKLVYGDNSGVPNQFDGLIKLIATGTASDQLVAMGATGGNPYPYQDRRAHRRGQGRQARPADHEPPLPPEDRRPGQGCRQ